MGAALVAAVKAHTNDVEVLRAACDSLYNLLVPYMRVACWCNVTVSVARSLQCCAAMAPMSHRDGCGTAAIVALKRHADDDEVAAAACGALWNLAAVGDNCAALVSDGAAEAVVAASFGWVGGWVRR